MITQAKPPEPPPSKELSMEAWIITGAFIGIPWLVGAVHLLHYGAFFYAWVFEVITK